MQILHILTYSNGGAAKAALRQHNALLNEGYDSKVLVLDKSKLYDEFVNLVQYSDGLDQSGFILLKQKFQERNYFLKQKKVLVNNDNLFDLFTLCQTPYRLDQHPLVKNSDIVNLHWVSNFLDFESFFKNVKKPIIWTLHDMNPFTGGCHYSDKCTLYQSNCEICPQLKEKHKLIVAKRELQHKKISRMYFGNISIVCLSDWLLQSSSKSSLFKNLKHHKIYNSIPLEVFKPIEKIVCRELLGIHSSKIVLLFVAENIENKRKGFHYLKAALEKSDNKDLLLVSVGKSSAKINVSNYIHLGTIVDERLMALAYNSADAFITPSIQDNLPNTMLESLCCGTPVIGFDIGGIGEIIKNNENGYLCENPSTASLEIGINQFLDNKQKFIRDDISNKAHQMFSQKRQAAEYIKLYENVIN